VIDDSEDSDIIAFGAETIMFKMDREGNGREYRKKLLGACDKCEPVFVCSAMRIIRR
jgi:hypothetical protein